MVPVGTALAGACVAWAATGGTAVPDGVVPLDVGVAVAEDPQANNRATNSRTIAFGRCLEISGLIVDCGTNLPPFLRITIK